MKKRKWFNYALIYLILIITSLFFLGPLYWIIITSLKFEGDVLLIPPAFIPSPICLTNYSELMGKFNFMLFSLNSMKVSILGTIGQLLSCSLAAFAFARLHFPGKKLLFSLLLCTMMIPSQVTLIPQFLIFNSIHLVNTHASLILPDYLARAFGVFLLRQFFLTVPGELEEAARIDGCSTFGIYWKIFLPIAKPSLATLCIFAFMDQWNDLLRPVVYLSDSRLQTITVGMSLLQNPTSTKWTLMMCGAVVSLIPLLLVYLFAQKYFVKGLITSGLKG